MYACGVDRRVSDAGVELVHLPVIHTSSVLTQHMYVFNTDMACQIDRNRTCKQKMAHASKSEHVATTVYMQQQGCAQLTDWR